MSISISRDFSDVPAGRFLADGDWTGQRFREDFLLPALKKADKSHPVIVDINDVEGYGSSFLEEAFGGLVRKEGYTKEELDDILKIEANATFEIYKDIILEHIAMAENHA